jgi:hypothetical protein
VTALISWLGVPRALLSAPTSSRVQYSDARRPVEARPITSPAVGDDASPRDRRIAVLLVILVVVVSLVARVVLLDKFYVTPDADQSIIGLMARHIQHGERPLFYWGQPYTGSGEAYITAALFTVFGQSDLLLHAVPLTASVLFAGLTTILALRLYGLGVAWLTGIFLAIAPSVLVDWGLWAGSGYLESMALGTMAMLLVMPPLKAQPPRRALRIAAAYFLLGLALWVQPLAGYYILAVCAMLVGPFLGAVKAPRRWPLGLLTMVGAGAAFLAGGSPLFVFNAQHDAATLGFLGDRATHLGALTVLSRLIFWAGPVLLGLMPPTTDRVYFLTFIQAHIVLYAIALVVVLTVLFRVASLWRKLASKGRTLITAAPAPEIGLIVLVIVALGGYVLTGWGAEQWAGSQPRYLLPLYSAVPMVVRAMLPATIAPRHIMVGTLLIIALVACDLYVTDTNFQRRDLKPLAEVLQAHGIRAIYGDYWLVFPTTYYSDERVIGVAVRDDLGNLHNNRYSPYLRAAAASQDYAWVVQTGSARAQSVQACLDQVHSRYTTFRWSDQLIIVRPTGRAFPWWNGGRCQTQIIPQ